MGVCETEWSVMAVGWVVASEGSAHSDGSWVSVR